MTVVQSLTPVFTYGTLAQGQKLHAVMEALSSLYLGEEYILPTTYDMVDLIDFPGLIETSSRNHHIGGELYGVHEENLYLLDGVEGVPFLYVRKEIPVVYWSSKSESEIGVNAWVYLFNRKVNQHTVPKTERFRLVPFNETSRMQKIWKDTPNYV